MPGHDTRDHVDTMLRAWADTEPDLDASPLEVAGRVLRLAAHLQREIDAALTPLGLSFGDFDVVNTLRREGQDGLTPTQLARAALITTGAMTTRLDRLEQRGLVHRQPDPVDRRSLRIHLTATGRRQAACALDAVLAADRRLVDPLGPSDRAAVVTGLRRMLVAAEAHRMS